MDVRERCSRTDWAEVVRKLVDEDYPGKDRDFEISRTSSNPTSPYDPVNPDSGIIESRRLFNLPVLHTAKYWERRMRLFRLPVLVLVVALVLACASEATALPPTDAPGIAAPTVEPSPTPTAAVAPILTPTPTVEPTTIPTALPRQHRSR